MANKDPVSLDGWTARRPVKLTQQEIDQAYSSRRDRTKVTLRLPRQVADDLRVWCATTRQHAQDLVTELLVSHFRMDGQTATDHDLIDLIQDDEVKKQLESSSSSRSSGRPDGQPRPTDPLTPAEIAELPDIEREVLRFFTTWTGKQPRQRDHTSFAEVAHLPRHHILAGIAMSRLRKGPGIRTLKYCVEAMHEAVEIGAGPDFLANLVRHLHKQASQPNLPGVGGDLKELNARNDSEV